MALLVLILAGMCLAERAARSDAMSARRLPPGIRRRGKGFTYTRRDPRAQQFSRKAGDTLDEAIAYKTRIGAERLMGTFQANSKTSSRTTRRSGSRSRRSSRRPGTATGGSSTAI